MILELLAHPGAYHSRRWVFVILALAGLGAHAEAPLRFEVASVKADKGTPERVRNRLQLLPGGRFVAENIPLYVIIAAAYNLPFQSSSEVRLPGAPQWVREERFDIEATPPEGAIPPGLSSGEREARVRSMLRALLADRFKLAVRTGRRDIPVYAIIIAKNGPKLQRSNLSEKDCADAMAAGGLPCHGFNGGQGRGLHSAGASIADVALFVSGWTDQPVVDQTGLKDLFRFDTEGWSPMRPIMIPPGMEMSAEQKAMSDPSRPTIFMIFDRMGLKLEATKSNVEIYTIEHVERPAEN